MSQKPDGNPDPIPEPAPDPIPIAKIEHRAPRETKMATPLAEMPYAHLSAIKIIPMSNEECQRILDLIDNGPPPKKAKNIVKKNTSTPEVSLGDIGTDDDDDLPAVSRKPNKKVAKIAPSPKETYSANYAGNSNTPPSIQYPSEPLPSNIQKRVFQCVYGKYKPYKKNKEWTFDGFMVVTDKTAELYGSSGRKKGSADSISSDNFPRKFQDGTRLVCGGFEAELTGETDLAEYESGAYFDDED